MSGSATEKTYEMLWDCRYCGQKKLLGLTHRFCASCGAPQDAAARYFPSEQEKVAVEEHQHVGVDLRCPACSAWNSRRSNCCTHCGGPLTAAQEARMRADQVRHEGQVFGIESVQDARREFGATAPPRGAQPKKKAFSVVVALAVVLGLGALGFACAFLFWTKPASFKVVGHAWERRVEIETFGPVRKSGWCDELPGGVKEISRRRETRSTKQVQAGEECSTRRKDQGDGTFKESRECKPKFRDEPVMGERCEYEMNAWAAKDVVTASGSVLEDTPVWPKVTLKRPGTCVGCDREGKRSERYEVKLVDSSSAKVQTCEFEQSKWSSFAGGSEWVGKVGVLSNGVDCDSLGPR
ncbi:uncharacterized protein CMC5_065570 [Chondromyces crocatus]|uniref:RanBP2-type domain-containing protein n=1 Tax=Chondromyces crocatus TaxID=52 RepID=A0A0K1ENB1_CHOCO|nr:uncharacterized protein CMC5_065570 [Chondromyces crocatus]